MLEELTGKVAALIDGKNALGFNVKFDLGDEGKILVAGNDAPMAVSNDDGAADTTLKVSAADFQSMLSGELNAMNAYMQGKLTVEGDMAKAMQLGNLF